MRRTLLKLTQDILSDLESDQITSVTDTEESLQVVNIIKNTFYDMITTRDWAHLETFCQFDVATDDDSNSPDTDRPNYFRIPWGENSLPTISEVRNVFYNIRTSSDNRDKYQELTYVIPRQFMEIVNANNSNSSNTEEVTNKILEDQSDSSTAPTLTNGAKYWIRNDKAPQYWTSFDDIYVAFDSYDSDVDTNNLDTSKTQIIGLRHPDFDDSTDSFIPDLPAHAFQELLNEAKSIAFEVLKQRVSEKTEQHAARQKRWNSQNSRNVERKVLTPNYGRKGKSHRGLDTRNPQFGSRQ